MPAAEEDDGGDSAQQKQQEEEGALDAVGSQQDQESRGDHGAGEAGAARRRRGWRAAAQAPARGAHRSGGHGRARISASSPAHAAPRPAQWLHTPRQQH